MATQSAIACALTMLCSSPCCSRQLLHAHGTLQRVVRHQGMTGAVVLWAWLQLSSITCANNHRVLLQLHPFMTSMVFTWLQVSKRVMDIINELGQQPEGSQHTGHDSPFITTTSVESGGAAAAGGKDAIGPVVKVLPDGHLVQQEDIATGPVVKQGGALCLSTGSTKASSWVCLASCTGPVVKQSKALCWDEASCCWVCGWLHVLIASSWVGGLHVGQSGRQVHLGKLQVLGGASRADADAVVWMSNAGCCVHVYCCCQ